MSIGADLQAVLQRIASVERIDVPTYGPVNPLPATQEDANAFAALLSPGEFAAQGGQAIAPAPYEPQALAPLIDHASKSAGLDPALVQAVIANESAYDANATSRTGARGLMQLEDGTAAELGVTNAYDPQQNVAGGTQYLRSLLDRFHGNLVLAVAAYNAGPGAVEQWNGVPPYAETQRYVQSVLSTYDQLRSTHT